MESRFKSAYGQPEWSEWAEVEFDRQKVTPDSHIPDIFTMLLRTGAESVTINMGDEVYEFRIPEGMTVSQTQRFARKIGMKLKIKVEFP